MSVVGGIISGASSLLGNLFGGLMSNTSSKTIARENRQFALDMYKLEQRYNHPINQVFRYREAGLNPALLYGNIDSGNVTAPKSFDNPRRDYSYIQRASESFAEGVQMVSALKDIDIKKAQEDKIKAETAQTLIGNQTLGDINTANLSIQQEKLKQFIENNAWLPKLNALQFEKGRLGNYILQYNADFTPNFLANRLNKEIKDLKIQDLYLANYKQNLGINAIKRALMKNELEFSKETLKNRLLGLRLQNNLLNLQGQRALEENKYLPEFLQLRNKESVEDVNYKNLQNLFKRSTIDFDIDKSMHDSNIKRKTDVDFYTNRYLKPLLYLIPLLYGKK